MKGWRALFAGQSHQHEGAARLICDRVDFWRLEGRVTMQSAAGLQRDGLAALAQARWLRML